MDAYFKINLLEARIEGLMKEINRLEGVKDLYHAEGNLIEISIQKASIRLYNNSEIISQLRYNNWDLNDFALNVVSNKVCENASYAIIELPSKQAFDTIKQKFIYFNNENCPAIINGLVTEGKNKSLFNTHRPLSYYRITNTKQRTAERDYAVLHKQIDTTSKYVVRTFNRFSCSQIKTKCGRSYSGLLECIL